MCTSQRSLIACSECIILAISILLHNTRALIADVQRQMQVILGNSCMFFDMALMLLTLNRATNWCARVVEGGVFFMFQDSVGLASLVRIGMVPAGVLIPQQAQQSAFSVQQI